MRTCQRLVAALVLVGASASGAAGQIRPIPPPIARQRPVPRTSQERTDLGWHNLYRVGNGSQLRVTLRDDMRRGRFVSVAGDSLTINDSGQIVTLRRDDVLTVELRTTEARRRGIQGAVSGAGAGLLLSAMGGDSDRATEYRLKFMSLGALLGGASGALGGSFVTTERLIYRAN